MSNLSDEDQPVEGNHVEIGGERGVRRERKSKGMTMTYHGSKSLNEWIPFALNEKKASSRMESAVESTTKLNEKEADSLLEKFKHSKNVI